MKIVSKVVLFTLAGIGLLFCVGAGIGIVDQLFLDPGARPTADVRSLKEFLVRHPHAHNARTVSLAGSHYFLLTEDRKRRTIPTSAGYVFDSKGNFVMWVPEIGDPIEGVMFELVSTNSKPITIEEVVRRTDATKRDGEQDGGTLRR